MPSEIADYALLSNCRTAALVSRDGAIDWLCLPRYDSASVFGALLGDDAHGSWQLRPDEPDAVAERHYDGDTFTLVTRWTTPGGVAEVHDALTIAPHTVAVVERIDLVRRLVGVSGSVAFTHRLRMRPDYARALPWVRQRGTRAEPELVAIAGPDSLVLRGAKFEPEDHSHRAQVTVAAGEVHDTVLTWHPSHREPPRRLDVAAALDRTRTWWTEWADRIDVREVHRAEVVRSLLILRALTHRDTGGIIAAATTSLPEQFGGERNWDYRFVWLRDAALTLEALVAHGILQAAGHWRSWLLRAIAGDPSQMQIVYGIGGERDLLERELESLPGYRGSAPVRIGNGAALQYQADVIGEVLVALHATRDWRSRPSRGRWSVRSSATRRRGSTNPTAASGRSAASRTCSRTRGRSSGRPSTAASARSASTAWRAPSKNGSGCAIARARRSTRAASPPGGWFTQFYGSTEVDASLLLLPAVGFCAPDDPRMLATVAEIERTLVVDSLVHRYRTDTGVDGLGGDENPSLACSLWLAEQYARSGRVADARAMVDRVCALANDVGMFSEEYDVAGRRQAGNTPQALSHLALVRAADAVHAAGGRG